MSDDMSDRRGWHISKQISYGHILTTLGMILTAMWFFSNQDTRLSNAELEIKHIQQGMIDERERNTKQFDEVKAGLRVIDGKLDRLILER